MHKKQLTYELDRACHKIDIKILTDPALTKKLTYELSDGKTPARICDKSTAQRLFMRGSQQIDIADPWAALALATIYQLG